jgi:hypothetical protein
MGQMIMVQGNFAKAMAKGQKFFVKRADEPTEEGAEGVEQIVVFEEDDHHDDLNYRYDLEIRQFFEGRDICSRDEKGHVWICEHGLFDTLTVEPPEGGQYEIAIRIRSKTIAGDPVKNIIGCQDREFTGYKIAGDGHLVGYNTDGH